MANIRISQLPTAPSSITGSELVPIVQNGQTVQTTVSAIVNSPTQTQTFATINNEPTLPNSRRILGGLGIGVTDGGAQGSFTFALNATSGSLENASTGIIAKISGNTVAPITIQSSGSGISVTNGNGVSGNPTIALTGLNSILSTLSGTGLLAASGGSSLSAVTIAGTANQIAVTNGASSPVIGIVSNPVIPGSASLTLPIGSISSRPSSPVNGMMRYNSDTNVLEGYIGGSWQTISTSLVAGVTSFSAGTTGFTPNTSSTGVVTLAGTLAVTNGGTGQTTSGAAFNALSPITTAGDLIYGSGINTATRLGIGTNGQYLTVVSGLPAWSTVSPGTVTSVSGTGTVNGLTLTGTVTTSGSLTLGGTLTGINLTTQVTGQLPVANGGTGLNTLTTGYIPYGNGTSAFASNSGFTFSGTTLTAPTLSVTSTINTTPNLTFNASNSGITSGASVAGNYLQTIIQNKSGTAGASTNYVLSNDLGTDSTYYGEFGMNSSVFSASTPTDFYSINNGIYFSGHDGDISVGSGNGYKLYFPWGSTGSSAHVINASGALGFSTNLGTTPALSGTTGFGTSGQVLISSGSTASPAWGTLGIAGGGTNLTTTPTNGQLLIGNGTNYTLSTLTSGVGMTVTNASGSITIANAGVTSIIAGTGISISGATGDVTINSSSSMVYPSAGIPNSTGSAWGTSYSTTGTGNVVLSNQPTISVTGSGFTLQDATDNTKNANFVLSGLATATNYTYALPALSGSTLAVLGLNQTFTGTQSFSSIVATATVNMSQGTTNTVTIGSSTSTGTIILGQATGTQITNIQAGATASASTKTINIGTGGLSGSTTTIAIGSTASTTTVAANGKWTFAQVPLQTPASATIGVSITPSGTISQLNVQTLTVGTTFQIPSSNSDGQKLTIRIVDNGTAQTLSWIGTTGGYRSCGATLPTTTVAGKYLYVGFIYNAFAAFWDCVAVAQQA